MTSDVYFGPDPIIARNTEARLLRDWYENHRETWRDRLQRRMHADIADTFMLGLMGQAIRIRDARETEDAARAASHLPPKDRHHG